MTPTLCELCGEPMPPGEEMFKYHGYSCDCPKPPKQKTEAALTAAAEAGANGGGKLPIDRDELGRMVREAWVRWALTQPNPKPSWLTPYNELSEPDKEADRQIGEAICRCAQWLKDNLAGEGIVLADQVRQALLKDKP